MSLMAAVALPLVEVNDNDTIMLSYDIKEQYEAMKEEKAKKRENPFLLQQDAANFPIYEPGKSASNKSKILIPVTRNKNWDNKTVPKAQKESQNNKSIRYNLAVMNFKPESIITRETEIPSNKLRPGIFRTLISKKYLRKRERGHYVLLERDQMDRIIDRYNRNRNDFTNPDISNMMKVDRIVVGSAGLADDIYSASTYVVDVAAAKLSEVSGTITGDRLKGHR